MPPWLRGLVPVLVAIAVLAVLQLLLGDLPFFVYLASIVGVNVILAVSLNIVNGMTGQFSIGHAGFMAVGAYTAGKLSLLLKDVAIAGLPTAVSDQVQFVGTLLVGGIAAAICGFIVGLPSLRLRGDYLAIVTLGFGEIIRVIVQNLEVFGRALGLSGIPQTSSLFAVWFCVFLVVLAARRIVGSTHGRSLWAIDGERLAKLTKLYAGEGRTLPPGGSAVVFMDVSFARGEAPPPTVLARVTATRQLAGPDGTPAPLPKDFPFPATYSFTGAGTPVAAKPAVVVEPPLKGRGWVAVNGCSDDNSMTAFVSPSNKTGSTTMFVGRAAPRLEWMLV